MFYAVFPSTLGRAVELNPVTPSEKLLDDTPFTGSSLSLSFFFFPFSLELSCSAANGILLDQGLNSCLLHWQADSLPLSQPGKNPHHCLISHLPNDAFWNDLLDNLYSHSSLRWSQLPGSPTYDYKCNCIKFLPFSVLLCWLFLQILNFLQ